jgi:hypothetical protein
MKKLTLFIAVSALALGLAACGGSSSDGGGGGDVTGTAMPGLASCTVQNTTQGVVCGKAVAADGTTPLAGAEVRLATASAQTLSTVTTKGVEDTTKCVADTSGDFACLVPAGTSGATSFLLVFAGFTDKTFSGEIAAGVATDTGTQTMSGSTSSRWVVVPGAYDGVQVLLSQLKGCTLNDMSGNPFDPATMDPASARGSDSCLAVGLLVLDDMDTTSQYYVPDFLLSASLADYASLFINCAADYSGTTGVDAAIQAFNTNGGHIYFSDLADSWLTTAFPGMINFGPANTSSGPPNVSASVPYAPLAAVVGDPIDIVFDLGSWADIDTVEAGVTTYIQGDISALSTLTGVHPITVGWRPASATGCIFYTSYHIEGAGTGTGTPQENAIKYLVQNIATVCQ